MSQNNQQRPTPETDEAEDRYGNGNAMHTRCHDLSHLSYDFADFARKLERERDEALAKLSTVYRWIEKNSGDGFIDSQTHVQNLQRISDYWCDRLDNMQRERDEACKFADELTDKYLKAAESLQAENKAMREAIREVYRVLDNALFVHQAITTYAPQDAVDKIENQKHCDNMKTALAKLQPFLKS